MVEYMAITAKETTVCVHLSTEIWALDSHQLCMVWGQIDRSAPLRGCDIDL